MSPQIKVLSVRELDIKFSNMSWSVVDELLENYEIRKERVLLL